MARTKQKPTQAQLQASFEFPDTAAADRLHLGLKEFSEFGKPTQILGRILEDGSRLPVYVNEFWTAKQRAAHRLHEVSYRACFKPQLPRFFISRLTEPGDIVYDPFMGRGTTLLEAGLLGRIPAGCDINPLSTRLVEPRFSPPTRQEIAERLGTIDLFKKIAAPDELLVFYHPKTLQQIANLRAYFQERLDAGKLDAVDGWIRMVATNRLTGHSAGFFSVYSLPPNQAVSVKSQTRINERRSQVPPERDVATIILKKSKSLLSTLETDERSVLSAAASQAQFFTASCDSTPALRSDSVSLVVTSPPFLDVVDYETDNWLRCWFNHIDPKTVGIWQLKKPADWSDRMTGVFHELRRVLKPGGHIAFEVGEVLSGKVQLEDLVVPAGVAAGLTPILILINDQIFTKTSNCWGVDNLSKGTNTNRIVLFRKD
ncbi:MAG: site-specific DNA-methyltransferase [Verrucomicrobiae bacterium]|nr:site-specific DNA-methyltransferase [Verrucomicrobiae bacterium]